jgi:hypothetical protein
LNILGGFDLFVVSSHTNQKGTAWSRPRLVPGKIPVARLNMRDRSLICETDDLLVFSFYQPKPAERGLAPGVARAAESVLFTGWHKIEIRLSEVLADQDNDGWTDVEEQRLGLNPQRADTDGDGLADGEDPCPAFASPKGQPGDEESQIIQRALFATFGLSEANYLLLVRPESPKVQVWGYRGPILYGESLNEWRQEHSYGGIFINWTVTRNGDEAKVTIRDYVGPEAAGSQDVYLRKIAGQWFVVRRQPTRVA